MYDFPSDKSLYGVTGEGKVTVVKKGSGKMNNKKKKKKRSKTYKFAIKKSTLLIILLIAAAITAALLYVFRPQSEEGSQVTAETLDNLNLARTDRLMIVAHPDDETLWGGSHLLDGGYLVVCLTNGSDDVRSKEFEKVVTMSGNIPLILNYPDKVYGSRDNWDDSAKNIQKDIETILTYKNWKMVVTHNPEGEYGHIQHKKTSSITVQAYLNTGSNRKFSLFFFGDYYKATKIKNADKELLKMSDGDLQRKKQLLSEYDSQEDTIEKFSHMLPYENWKEY